jgi:hypothetical protein
VRSSEEDRSRDDTTPKASEMTRARVLGAWVAPFLLAVGQGSVKAETPRVKGECLSDTPSLSLRRRLCKGDPQGPTPVSLDGPTEARE